MQTTTPAPREHRETHGTSHTMSKHRRPAGGDDTGSVTLFLVVTVTGLLLVAGLVVDGGAKVRAIQHADRLAAEAARAGGQAIDVPAAIPGDTPAVDAAAAVTAAHAYLRSAGASGTVAVTKGGRALAVTVTTTISTVFLGLIGVHTLTARGSAEVALIRGVTGAAP